MDYKLIAGSIGIIFTLIAYAPYFYNMFKNKTKPHVFTWFIWSLLMAIGYFAQISKGGGFGAQVTLISSLLSFSVFIVASFKYHIDYLKKIDWICLGGALLGILLWVLTKNPLIAVILVVITDAVGFVPTFRKAYHKPFEETSTLYAIGMLKYVFSIIALQSLNLTTVLYPASLILTNGTFVAFLAYRRSSRK